jgi:excisionase family DNA binding protein
MHPSEVNSIESLNMVKKRFRSEAFQFPCLRHILIIWPESELKPESTALKKVETYSGGVKFIQKASGSDLYYEYRILKAECETWRAAHGIRRFQASAQMASSIVSAMNPNSLRNVQRQTLATTNPIERWLLLLHDLEYSDHLTDSEQIESYLQPDHKSINPEKVFVFEMHDIFMQSFRACEWLLKRMSDPICGLLEDKVHLIDAVSDKTQSCDKSEIITLFGNPKITDEYISFGEAADILKVSRSTVYRLVVCGKLLDNKLEGKSRKVSKTSVLFFRDHIEKDVTYSDGLDIQKDARANNPRL